MARLGDPGQVSPGKVNVPATSLWLFVMYTLYDE